MKDASVLSTRFTYMGRGEEELHNDMFDANPSWMDCGQYFNPYWVDS